MYSSQTRLYSDEPPPYDLVTSDHYLSGHLNQATSVPPYTSTAHNDQNDHPQDQQQEEEEVFNVGYYDDDDDDLQPPPHYEDFVRETESELGNS
nr:hypothetical protein BaRGS_000347 [Batillaria attramentaria]